MGDMNTEIKAAFIGHTKYPVLSATNKIVFRQWNDRQIREMVGKQIVDPLQNAGMQGFIPENMIVIMVRKSEIEAEKLTQDKLAGSELPELKLKTEQVEIFVVDALELFGMGLEDIHWVDNSGQWY
ncbi:hypothetical protein BJ138DRAFT_1106267 [Hygrophoropsis aurantiaca]|uniref:Uncharacterized protein n=1 Tax=Hygrophoropsis aurantiaca TaxID=72124 RepID=A0ACB7ZVL6_9AGAM|nr:hypothetical protein BJ138DRAFT_1106267 [Hygrophoropsis aurantiaca]